MNLGFFIERLEDNKRVFNGLARNVSDAQARWKPTPERWSILEVVNHLYDEEREDFRQRLDYTLNRPGEVWPKIDPQNWVIERGYNKRELAVSIGQFLHERERSISWLKGLASPDWQMSFQHTRGVLKAGDLLASWLAHDFLHMRQITRLHYEYLSLVAAPFETAYAGQWPAG